MVKKQELSHGMARKWERHFTGKWRIMGQAAALAGFLILMLGTVLWPQIYFPKTFDSILTFELVVDQKDADAQDWTYNRFIHFNAPESTRVTRWTFWTISNANRVLEAGVKPQVEEIGPFAAVLDTYKYDISFSSDDDARFVKYKEWSIYREVEKSSACKHMFYAMDIAEYLSTNPDCGPEGRDCDCMSLDKEITVANHLFYKLMHKHTPNKLGAWLVQEAFEKIENYLTTTFVTSIKRYMAEGAMLNIINFRKAVAMSQVLQSVYESLVLENGTAYAQEAFRGDMSDSGFRCSDKSQFLSQGLPWESCPWGVGSFVKRIGVQQMCNGTVELTEDEAKLFLGEVTTLPNGELRFDYPTTSIFNNNTGVYLWAAAGRSVRGVVEDIMIEPSLIKDQGAEQAAFSALVNATLAVGTLTLPGEEECFASAKIIGIAHWLFSEWFTTEQLDAMVAREWGDVATPVEVACDVGNFPTPGDRFPLPGIETALYVYPCNWPLWPWRSYFRPLLLREENYTEVVLDDAAIQAFMNPSEATTGTNRRSILLDENRMRYFSTYQVLEKLRNGSDFSCDGFQQTMGAGLRTAIMSLTSAAGVPTLPGVDVWQFHTVNIPVAPADYFAYLELAGALGAYYFNGWGESNVFLDTYIADWFTNAYHEDFLLDPAELYQLGYAQFAGSYVTKGIWGEGVPSVRNIKLESYMKFAPEEYQSDRFIDFLGNAIEQGYPFMNMTLQDGKSLLKLLSSKADDAVAFRHHLLDAQTTYRCDIPNQVPFMCQENPEEYCSNSREQFVDFNPGGTGTSTTCVEGEKYYIKDNAFTNFRWDSPHNPTNTTLLEYTTLPRNEFERLGKVLDEASYSSALNCEYVDRINYFCDNVNDDTTDSMIWIDQCDVYMTQVQDSAFGLFCTLTSVGEGYNSHPYPRKRGNVLASMMQKFLLEVLLVGEGYYCDDPLNCDYSMGGILTTQPVRNFLFNGYVDTMALKILNAEWASRNVSFGCNEVPTRDITDSCEVLYSPHCGAGGFYVEYPVPGGFERWNIIRGGKTEWAWYTPEIELPHSLGTFTSPVFAMYAGRMWRNETFQKERECEQRVFDGPAGRFKGCEIEIETGHADLQDLGKVVKWYGNRTFYTTPEQGDAGSFNLSTATRGKQFAPKLWEGFAGYAGLLFHGRLTGTEFLGDKSLELLAVDHLMELHLERIDTAKLSWPLRTEIEASRINGSVGDYSVNGNRYIVSTNSWAEARARNGDTYRDHNGEIYQVPQGFVSLQSSTDFPIFVGGPHMYLNYLLGGTEFVEFIGIRAADDSAYKYYESLVDVEPITGKTFRSTRRLQYSYRLEKSLLFPHILQTCRVPCDEYVATSRGCVIYFPGFWVDESWVMDQRETARLVLGIMSIPGKALQVSLIMGFLGPALLLAGIAAWKRVNKQEQIFKEKIYVD